MITLYLKNNNTFQSILNRTKTIELRLHTPFFKQLQPLHCITFQYQENTIPVQITNLSTFTSIHQLRQQPNTFSKIFPYYLTADENPIDKYYSPERQKKYLLLAIKFTLLN